MRVSTCVVDCCWSIAVEYGAEKEFVAEDIPVVCRKRCNTMPGTFAVVHDDAPQDDDTVNDGLYSI